MTTYDPRSGGISLFVLGLLLGLAVGSIGVYAWQQREIAKLHRQHDSKQVEVEKQMRSMSDQLEALQNRKSGDPD